MNTIYEDEIASKNAQMYLIYGMTGVLVVLSLLINIFGIDHIYIYIIIIILYIHIYYICLYIQNNTYK